MKKQILLTITAALLSIALVNAQNGGGMPRRTVQERVNTIHLKLDSAFNKPDAAKLAEMDSIFANYYRTQDKYREEMMAGGAQPDRDAMRAKMQEFAAERDEKLKKVMTEEQMKKWKDEIESTLRPQRGGMRPQGQ